MYDRGEGVGEIHGFYDRGKNGTKIEIELEIESTRCRNGFY